MSSGIMIKYLQSQGLSEAFAHRLYSQIRKGAALHVEWNQGTGSYENFLILLSKWRQRLTPPPDFPPPLMPLLSLSLLLLLLLLLLVRLSSLCNGAVRPAARAGRRPGRWRRRPGPRPRRPVQIVAVAA